jgi:predicted MPP superfamily phosphohydrolase
VTVLRFSNYEVDTISAHQEIIDRFGYVYWGWWKKQHEPWPERSIESLSHSCHADKSTKIGLVERQAEKFYVASCESLASDSATRMPSPEPESTPSYYRDKLWPLWMKFTSLQEVTEEQWRKEFGDVPQGDETFFDQSRSLGVDLISGEVKGDRSEVLHISDLHFGDDFGFSSTQAIAKRNDLLECIAASVASSPPLAIVVSGDLTTRGSDAGLRSARLFIERLATRLDVPKNCVIIAPGNHDILIDDPEKNLDFSNEQGYRDLVSLFYGRKTGLERVHIVRGQKVRLVFGVLNSSRPRTKANMDYGYVGRDRSEPVIREVHHQASAHDAWSFLVLHHHVQPAPLLEFLEHDRPVSLTLDAGEIISFAQSYGVKAILHGHQHLPFVGKTSRLAEIGEDGPTEDPKSRSGVLILGAGSAGVQVNRLGGEMPENSFACYRPGDDGSLGIRVFRYTPVAKPKILWDFIV